MLVTVAMGAYDEAPNVAAVVAEALSAIDEIGGDGEVLVVDDGSTDGTSQIADDLASRDGRVRVIHHPANRGFSGAMTSALRGARGDWIYLGPADGQFDIHDLSRYLAVAADADIVVGVRAHRPDGMRRVVMSRGFHLVAKALFPVPLDEFSSTFLFRRSLIEGLPIRSRPRAATVLPEVLYRSKMRGARFVQVPIQVRPRTAGKAKGGRLSVALRTVIELVRLAPLVRVDELRRARRTRETASSRR
jgi:glycosyltransferase involved in cell wall biosynthesis